MTPRDRLPLAVVGFAVALSVLLVGGAPRWAQAIVATISAAAIVSTVRSRRRFERWPPLLVLIGVAALWTALQLLPLPDGLVAFITPTLDSLRTDGSELARISPRTSLSMDPPATLRALAFLVTLAGLAYVTLRLAITERGRYYLMVLVAGAAAVAAMITGAHELVGASALYGLYEPVQGQPLRMGPLLNSNHLGCLMAVGAVTNLALLAYPKHPAYVRVGATLAAVACIAVATSTLSRGAVLGLLAGVLVLGTTMFVQRVRSQEPQSRSRRERFVTVTLPAGVLIMCGLLAAIYLGPGNVTEQIRNTSLREVEAPTSKFAAWRSTLTLLEETPWVGVGRGAFESTFPRVHPASAFNTFSHPENETLQALVEWGVPAMVVLACCFVWLIACALRRWRGGPLAAGALGGLAAIAFQSVFDFGLELLGIAVPAILLTAIVTHVPLTDERSRSWLALRSARLAAAVGIACAALLLLTPLTSTPADDHVRLRTAVTDEQLLEVIERHPLDYVGYAMLAQRALRGGQPNAVSVLNHAMRLHPTHSGLHRLAAQLLLRTGRAGQALSEYSMAIHYSSDPRDVLGEVVRVLPAANAASAIPADADVDRIVAILNQQDRADVAELWLLRVLQMVPTKRASEALYSVAMSRKSYVSAERAARVRCQTAGVRQCEVAVANALWRQGDHARVIQELANVQAWRGRADERIEAWFMLCDAHAALAQTNKARTCLQQLQISGLVPVDAPELVQRRAALPDAPLLP